MKGREYDLVEFVAEVDRVDVVTLEVRKHYNLVALSSEARKAETSMETTDDKDHAEKQGS